MKKKCILYIFSCLLLQLSCNERDRHVQIVALPDAVELTSTPVHIDVELLLPTRTLIKGDKLFVFEQLAEDMFKVFDFPSLTYLHSFGNMGRGPNEFLTIIGNDEIIDSNTEFVEVLDYETLKFIDFSSFPPFIQSTISLPLPILKQPVNRMRKINDSIYYFSNWFDGDDTNEFTRININTGQISYFSPYPKWIKNFQTTNEKYLTYSKLSGYSFIHQKIVAFYYHYPALKFIDYEGNVIKEIRINTSNSNFSVPNIDDVYFMETQFFTNDHIYVIWLGGKPYDEIFDNPKKYLFEILVFDWEGNIADRYRLDQPICAFTISEKTGKMYCTPFPEIEPITVIYEYDIPLLK